MARLKDIGGIARKKKIGDGIELKAKRYFPDNMYVLRIFKGLHTELQLVYGITVSVVYNIF